MPETTKTLLTDIAVAGAVALAVGALVACASWPLVQWLEDRRSDRRAAGPSLAAAPVVDDRGPTTPPVVLSLPAESVTAVPGDTLEPFLALGLVDREDWP